MRNLKCLEGIVDFTSVHWYMDLGGIGLLIPCLLYSFSDTLGLGWRFVKADEKLSGENVVPDSVNGVETIPELYLLADRNYTGRFSVPVLWDKKTRTIVNNESSEIIRMFATEFDELIDEGHKNISIVPSELRATIDEMNQWIYVTYFIPYWNF
jgi:glutathionyl-hydroquinone reductase